MSITEAFSTATPARRVWEVGALCRAIADALEARFNPVTVKGEITGFSRAGSGHCYFSIKDAGGQLRCAMFRGAASRLNFVPRDGELVEVRGKLGVYEQRGDLQLIVDHMQRAGQGTWFEQFLRLKAQLEAEGLFDASRKRAIAGMPRGIGIVTSLGAAALHDVATALQRRAPHVPVVLVPSLVQGADAPASIVAALQQLYALAQQGGAQGAPHIDTILLVRGGGSMEDLWAFNDEAVARTIVQSPVPLVSGVGHETDFTIADFCADVRAPTPTAAAELAAWPQQDLLGGLAQLHQRMQRSLQRHVERHAQRVDTAAMRLGRPTQHLAQQRRSHDRLGQRVQASVHLKMQREVQQVQALSGNLTLKTTHGLQRQRQRLAQVALRLQLLDPQHVMARGWAVLTQANGQVVTSIHQAPVGTPLKALVADGSLDLTVTQPKLL